MASGMLAHSSQTVPSVSSLWTSQPPHVHGVQFDPRSNSFGNDGESEVPLLAVDNLTIAEEMSGCRSGRGLAGIEGLLQRIEGWPPW